MKTKLVNIVLTIALLSVAGTGVAESEDKNYLGVQYGVGDYSEDGISRSFNPTAYMIRVGRYFSSDFSIEGRLGAGLEEDTQFLPEFGASGLDASLELDSIMGVYGLWHIDLSESSAIYGILGASKVKGTVSLPKLPASKSSDSETGFSYGIGVDIGFSGKVALNIEYLIYLDKSRVELSAIVLGVTTNF